MRQRQTGQLPNLGIVHGKVQIIVQTKALLWVTSIIPDCGAKEKRSAVWQTSFRFADLVFVLLACVSRCAFSSLFLCSRLCSCLGLFGLCLHHGFKLFLFFLGRNRFDSPLRARLGAHLAVFALVIVDDCDIVHHMDSIKLTGLFTLHAANARIGAHLHGLCALVAVHAVNVNLFGLGNQVNEFLGTSRHTLTASDALFRVNDRFAVHDMQRIECTFFYTGAQTHAAVCTFLRAACHAHRRVAVLKALILCLIDRIAAAVTVNMCNLGFTGVSFNAHHFGNLSRSGSTADRTTVDRCFALYDGSRQTVTARIAAAAAVCARQTFAHQRYALIDLDGKHLCRDAQQQREHDAHDKQHEHRRNNIHDIHFLSF